MPEIVAARDAAMEDAKMTQLTDTIASLIEKKGSPSPADKKTLRERETFTIEKRHHPVFGDFAVAVVYGNDYPVEGRGEVAFWGWNYDLFPPTPVVIRSSHKEARENLLTEDEWDYSVRPGEFAGGVFL